MFVQYVDHMGTDLSVVNAARSSFDKQSEWVHTEPQPYTGAIEQIIGGERKWLSKADHNLIQFLARGMRSSDWDKFVDMIADTSDRMLIEQVLVRFKEGATHWAPFSHPHLSLRIETSVAVARQLVKHQIGFAWSEVSRRYIDSLPEFEEIRWRERAANVKQGSSDIPGTYPPIKIETSHGTMSFTYLEVQKALAEAYVEAVAADGDWRIAPEQARMTLPLAMKTSWTWTGSLYAWARMMQARLDSHAQKETRDVAEGIYQIIRPLFPESVMALTRSYTE